MSQSSKLAATWSRIETRDTNLSAEAQRISDIKASGHVPIECGDAIPAAPARGPVRSFDPIARYPDGKDGYVLKSSGYRGRKALALADPFDQLRYYAARARKPAPFTKLQEDAGRHYRDLTLDLQSRGFAHSSLCSTPRGSSSGRDFMERYSDDQRQLLALQHRIGNGVALPVRRLRPSERGSKRGILDRDLVDLFVLHEKTLSDILLKHGWKANGKTRATLLAALGATLDRLATPLSGNHLRHASGTL